MAVHRHADAVGLSDDAGSAGLVPEKRQLTEVAADLVLTDALRFFSLIEDFRGVGLAIFQEVKQASLFALRDDGISSFVFNFFERFCDL